MNKYLSFTGSVIVASLLAGCGGGGATTPAESTSITIVDPYIQGATVFWDKNENGILDNSEPESTASDDSGKATFDVKVTDGARIIMNTKGMHNGEAYTGTLTAKYSSTGVVSPLTTLEEKGYTKTEIVNLLATSGITLSEADITADPMVGLGTTNTIATDANLAKIQASVAINTFLDMKNMYAVTKKKADISITDFAAVATLMKETITASNVSSSNADTMIKAAVAMGNYVIQNPTDLATINTNKATIISKVKTALTTNKDAQFKITDTTGTVSQLEGYGVSNGISYVKNLNMTAQDYVASLLTSSQSGLNIEYEKPGIIVDGDKTLLTNKYVGFWNGATNSYTDFSYDWANSTSNNPIWKKETSSGGGIAPTSQAISTTKYRTKHAAEEDGFVPNDECTILSVRKVDKILGISVDATEIKEFCAYGNGDNYAVGEGWENSGRQTANSIELFADYYKENSSVGQTFDNLVLTSDNKMKFKDTGEIVIGSYWKIENGILKVKDWDEVWYKLENGVILENYIGDTAFEYYGVTDSQAKQITTKMGLPNW